jgi:hypothetical protein
MFAENVEGCDTEHGTQHTKTVEFELDRSTTALILLRLDIGGH